MSTLGVSQEVAHWLSIVVIAIVGIALFKVVAAKIRWSPLVELADFI